MLPFQTPGVVADVDGVPGDPVAGVVGVGPDAALESALPPLPQAVNARLAAISDRVESREPKEPFMNFSNGTVKAETARKRPPPGLVYFVVSFAMLRCSAASAR